MSEKNRRVPLPDNNINCLPRHPSFLPSFLSSNLIPKRELLCHLHGGDSHSVLYSLHHLTNLPALNEEEVLKLLQKEPTKDLQGEHGELDRSPSEESHMSPAV